jgi:eukaryotic-like serine/threonine-protein kinase
MTAAPPVARPATRRMFGRYELKQVLGRSAATMTWLAFDPRQGADVMLSMPRTQPADGEPQQQWLHDVQRAARLRHPNLAPVTEFGVQDRWPYICVDRALGMTLTEFLPGASTATPNEVIDWVIQLLSGLAFAHESGFSHRDLQFHHVLMGDGGAVRLMGVELALLDHAPTTSPLTPLQRQRHMAARDLLACGLLMHRLVGGLSPLDEPDIGLVVGRLPPLGRDIVRLPWSTPHPIPEALRVIVNRATDRQPQHRYFTARSLLRALEGWREAASKDDGGALALMLDRMQQAGHLPAMPDMQRRVVRVTQVDGQHARAMAASLLQDMGLSFELLRLVNTAEVRNAMMGGNGPVLTLRRAIALIGLRGVQRAARALRTWPGPLNETQAQALSQVMDNARIAAGTAVRLRPPGYDSEVVYMLALLQNLGRLLVQYHFPDEAQQIRQLMLPVAPGEDGSSPGDGMTEREASYAVLGIDSEAIGAAVARHWGLSDDVLVMIRRHPLERGVHGEGDTDLLRAAASAGNEALDALLAGDSQRVSKALVRVVQRFGRALDFTGKDLQNALQAARLAVRDGRVDLGEAPATEPAPL